MFSTSVGMENFFGVSGTPWEYNASGKPLLCLSFLIKQKVPGLNANISEEGIVRAICHVIRVSCSSFPLSPIFLEF